MNKFIAILLVGAGMISAQGSWVPVNLGTQDTLRSVYCQSRSLCFAVGDKTVDISRDSGVVFRTANGGGTWTRTGFYGVGGPGDPNIIVNRFYSVQCLSNATCMIVGRGETPPVFQSVIFRTQDGGISWSGRGGGASGVTSINCPDSNACYVCSQSVHKSTDGGLNWLGTGGSSGADFLSIDCTNPTTCIAVGWCFDSTQCNKQNRGVIRKTSDGGLTWSYLLTNAVSGYLRSIFSINSDTGWTVGDSGAILRTVNGGVNWERQTGGSTRNLRSIHFLNSDTGWVVGDSGTILFTSNGGADWQLQNSGTFKNLYSVHFFNSSFGYIVGAGGTMLHYSSTVGILPGKLRQGRTPKKKQPDSPVFDTRGREAEGPCRSCFLDTRTGIRTIGD